MPLHLSILITYASYVGLYQTLFNVFDFVGKALPAWLYIESLKAIFSIVILRVLLVPILVLNLLATSNTPFFSNDLVPMIAVSLLALSNGYCGCMYTPVFHLILIKFTPSINVFVILVIFIISISKSTATDEGCSTILKDQ